MFEIEEWVAREQVILPGGHGVRSIAFTSKYIFDRAVETSELKLENEEELLQWREARRRGRVEVTLDHEHIDYAKKVIRVGLTLQGFGRKRVRYYSIRPPGCFKQTVL